MALLGDPPNATNPDAKIGNGWAVWFAQLALIIQALTLSGTTANRPTRFLWTGRPYFDTTIGKPIWYSGAGWIKADGTAA